MKDLTFQVALNQRYRDKVKPGDGRFWKFDMTFQTTRLTLPKPLPVSGCARLPMTCWQRPRPTVIRPFTAKMTRYELLRLVWRGAGCCHCRSRSGMGNGRFSRWATGYGRSWANRSRR